MNDHPNFVIIVPDQLRADALGCFGSPVAQTPHIDELAWRGTVFSETYVQHPVCAPSRASFLTGWYPHVRGHRTLTHLLRADEPNLLGILKAAGYHVAWAGSRGDTFAPGVTEQSVHEYGQDEKLALPEKPAGFPSDEWARVFYRGRVIGGGIGHAHDDAAVRTAERWLAAFPPEPWVLFVPLIAPHCPFEADEPWFSLHDRDSMPDPLPVPDGPEPAFKAAIREKYRTSRLSPGMWRELIAVYYGMVSALDHHVGRIQQAIRASGVAGRTVSIFFADHGEYLGDFGLIEKWPSGMDRCLTHDPLIISGAGLPRDQRSDALVELIDVMPTVLELVGVDAPHRHFGRSLMPVLEDPHREHREYAYTEGGFTLGEDQGSGRSPFPYDLKSAVRLENPRLVGRVVAVRDRDWTYVWRLYEDPELYHRRKDPHEKINLAGRSDLADVERRMERALLRWQIETADVIPVEKDPRGPTVALPPPASQDPGR